MVRLIVIFLFAGIFCTSTLQVQGQTKTIDALRSSFLTTGAEKEKLAIAIMLLDEYESLSIDTLTYYYTAAKNLLKSNFTKETSLRLSVIKIRLLRRQSKFEDAMLLCDSCFAVYNTIKENAALYRRLIGAKNSLYVYQLKYKEALDITYAALKKAEAENNDTSQINFKIGLGWIYMEMGKNREALDQFFAAAILTKKINKKRKTVTLYANIAAVYEELNKIDSAEFYIHIAFDYASKDDNLTDLANCYYIYSDIMVDRKNIVAAEKAMNDGLAIRKKIGDAYFYVSDLYQLAIFYASNNQPKKGINTALEGIDIAQKNNFQSKYLILYDALAQNYEVAGNDKLYAATLKKIITLKDSLYKNNSAQALADMQTKYDVQKKETLIAKQKLDLLSRKFLLYGAGVLAILFALFFGYRFKKYQQKQKTIAEQKRIQNEFAVKGAEEKERKRISAELHDNLGVQANAILHNSSLLNVHKESNKHVVEDLQDTAKEMLVNLRETLWAMKQTDVTANDLWLRIINFMKQMGRHYSTINFTLEGNTPQDFIIPSTKALNIVLILQETVNNAVKHAQAKTITAKSIINNTSWQLLIEDDGKGFDIEEAKQKNDSYGLTNMQERAKNGGFIYALQSKLGKGTITTVAIEK